MSDVIGTVRGRFAWTAGKLRPVIEAHIRRYSNMVNHPGRNVNVADASHYLRIWQGIEVKLTGLPEETAVWGLLAPFERSEVLEAMADEESDDEQG